MRKYQQLVLLLISCLSVGILLMYKTENNRLKYVLKYVNFFGRSDVAVLRRLENGTKEDLPQLALWRPMPVWQVIGDSFHAYSAYWMRKELVAGGEAHVLVVGKQGAVVDFRCSLAVGGTRTVQGKFRFQLDGKESVVNDFSTNFTSYHFFCQVSRDFGQPESVSFTDITSIKSPVKLRLQHLKRASAKAATVPARLPATVCVDLVGFNMTSRFGRNENALIQFFLTHQALGIEHFLVYNFDELPENIIRVLDRTNIHLYGLPFNFPFQQSNETARRVRSIIHADCLLRNVNQASFTILLQPNEVFYPNARFAADRSQSSLQQQLRHFSADTARFELATFSVCFDEQKKLLLDNIQYDPERKAPYKMLLQRLELPPTQLLANTAHVELSLSTGFAHRYVDCSNVGADGLHDWRNGVRADFMEHINILRNEVDLLI
ncbi:uncharacterized protein LOC117578602 [Drosophila guanche]|uniref:Glycosyltransferase family 92 protein n=1 Tax=Drosophila guanche TaxID=7266 RepID=A0A3B0JX83_DROGU|nr:uncharacterized protein LOC117578602 [Drosophila guanche]XP_034120084.1 uncharacterized protein LOC117578602 [Drosophila guanche]SPP75698.1 blast:NSFL1 cofactor p47 [Drosophila guanche]